MKPRHKKHKENYINAHHNKIAQKQSYRKVLKGGREKNTYYMQRNKDKQTVARNNVNDSGIIIKILTEKKPNL